MSGRTLQFAILGVATALWLVQAFMLPQDAPRSYMLVLSSAFLICMLLFLAVFFGRRKSD